DTTQNIYNIDGFNVYLYASDTKEMVTLGQIGNNESIINPSADVRKLTIPSVTANKYYYIGVQAYRRVDNDIESSGILLSNIVTLTICYPYLPEEMVNVQGRINGVMYTVDNKEPTLPQLNDIWTDTTTNTRKIYTSTGWEDANVGAASSVSGYYPDTTATPSTLVVRDDTGNISGVASLNSSGKVNYSVLPNSIIFGNYTGDGTQGRTITLPFTPRLIKVYTTNTFDVSLYITSRNGGYKQFVNNSLISLVGMTDYTPSPAFGKIIDNGFTISTDSNLYGNVQNFVYYFEAYL
ncbi:MAG: hypothetical protein Q8880_13550, partial [Bacteroidota bacterium]|nr:hypothetical protein [Bacteroidota bacterium]